MAVSAPSRAKTPARSPLRILTAVPLCDGHDSAITTINLELARHGAEVIYLGYHQSASSIARAAIQEDVHAIGLSSYNGGHLAFFKEVLAQLRARGGRDIPLFGGGGGTITAADARLMKRAGVHQIFFAGTPLAEIVATIRRDYTHRLKPDTSLRHDRALARAITLAEQKKPRPSSRAARPTKGRRPFVLGIAGPGGAGKSTLIDEFVARFLRDHPSRRVAILANDPTQPDTGGAILGDRVSAIYAQHDRVFFRSLATRGSLTGISAAMPAALDVLRRSGEFDLIFAESVGLGQESDPFGVFAPAGSLVDATLLVLSPHYGGRIQLQKIALLNGVDLVALNKCDDPRATTAQAELSARLASHPRAPQLYPTTAAQHLDPGVDRLFDTIAAFAQLEPAGGEKACQLEIND